MDYNIVLDNFEGPLDLLLKLIEKSKIDIYNIPISDITEQYISFIYKMEELNLELASDFLIMASSLLEIKSKMLLPVEKDLDEEGEEIDPREELVLRLLAYKKYKEAAKELKEYESIESQAYYKPQEDLSIEEDIDYQLDFYSLHLLVRSLNNILNKKGLEGKEMDIGEIRREEFTIKECVEDIIDRLQVNTKIKFSDLLKKNANRNEIVAYFLSVLELIKQKSIYVLQDEDFTDIFINKRNNEVL